MLKDLVSFTVKLVCMTNENQLRSVYIVKVMFWLFSLTPLEIGKATRTLLRMKLFLFSFQLLCLSNGERISILPSMKVIFEVDSLVHASPATISRCGMVFMVSITI